MQDGVVTFENKDYKNYTAENWNAVVLYNLVYYIYKHRNLEDKCTIDMFYNDYIKGNRIQDVCGEQFAGDIKKAFGDIKEYNRNLDIIVFFINNELLYGGKSRSCICENYDKYGLAKIEMIEYFAYKNAAKPGQDGINIYVKNGKIDRAIVYAEDAMYSCDFDDYMNHNTKDKNCRL